MRKMLATAVALAPLAIACGAQAEVEINTARTTPITTANATGSGADNIRVAGAGSITLSSGVAITLNSSHSVDMDSGSRIVMEDADDGATGILALGGNTGDITLGGSIQITDDLDAPSDTDNDGDADGEFASGADRYGVRVTGPGTLTGDIFQEAGSRIDVEGNQSYGLRVEAELDGDIRTRGTIVVTGTEAVGIGLDAPVSGDVRLGGTINVLGEDSRALVVGGDIAGRLTIEGQFAATGYRSIQRPLSQTALDNLDEDDLLQGGPAVSISADVDGGVLLNARPPIQNDDDEDEDEEEEDEDTNGDGVPDAEETTANVTSYGGAPAILVGSDSQNITLGDVGTGDEGFGFINRGAILGSGVYDEVNATGIQFGGLGGAVDTGGGIRNEGSISARSVEGSATAILLGDGFVGDGLTNTGTITTTSVSEGDDQAVSVDIAAGANITSLTNDGQIAAAVEGETTDAIGIRDRSGSLSTIVNTGGIVVAGGSGDVDVVYGGSTVAIDVSANTSGVVLTQLGVDDGDDDGDDDTTDPDADGDGVDDADEPVITGDILLGSGADVVDIRNGIVTGDLSFGDGADRLDITGGARVSGALADSDGLLDIQIANGTLDAQQTSQIDVSSLDVGADGDLIVTIDPAAGTAGGFNVNGHTSFADGAGLGVRFDSLLLEADRFVVVDSTTLDFGDIDTGSLEENSPYLFVATAGADIPAGQVYVDVRRRSADEMGLIASEEAALDSVYFALDDDDEILQAFLSQTDRDGFINLFEQMLPDHSGGSLMSLSSGVDAVTRALIGRNQTAAPGETSAWLQEINFYAEKDTDQSYGFESQGFGIAGGIERGTANGAFGLTAAFTSSDLEDPESEAEEVLSANLIELGLYWRAQGERWTTWARAAAGYAYFDSVRQLVGTGVFRRAESDWNGYTATAAGGVSYEKTMGKWYVRGDAMAEYFMLSEGSREETGGGDGFDLAIEDRDGHLLSATAAISIGRSFGRDGWIRPEIRLGYRQNISFDAGETIARFVSGGDPFTLQADTIEGGGPIIGFRLNVGNELGHLALEADAEMIDDYIRYAILLRASFRF